MHPLLQSRPRLLLYLAVWQGVGLLLAALLVGLGPRPFGHALAFTGPLALLFAFVSLSAWWVCRVHPLLTTAPLRLALTLLSSALQATVLWIGAAAVWAFLLMRVFGTAPPPGGIPADLLILFPAGLVLYAQSIALHYALLGLESARAAERRVLESQVSAREAELRALRTQLNPHFLFNSLNSISALAGAEPENARRMCTLLGDFLRTSLGLGARERVTLAEELALADHYLAIERVRFGERLAVARQVDPAAERCLVPPLLVQPLIENAVKHGVSDRVEGGTISIEARLRNGSLEITVENPRDPEAPPRRGSGLGLQNVRQRLAALDPVATRVDVLHEDERFRVKLTLPAVEGSAQR